MAIYILVANSGTTKTSIAEQRIRHAIPEATPVKGIEDFVSEIARGSDPAYLLLVGSSDHNSYFAKVADSTSNCRARIFFVLISGELSASDYKAVVRRGDADWVSIDADPQEVVDIIARHRRQNGAARRSDGGGAQPVAVSFVPSAGGVGNTTLALEAAIKLKTNKATRERSICLVDLDFQGSHVCDHLDIDPRLKIQEILDNPERLDSQLFEIFVSRHTSGLHVFAAPRSKLDLCEVNVSALDAFFSLASLRYDIILIDLASSWFPWTSQIIVASDGVIVTGVNSIPGLRQAAETVAAVRTTADSIFQHLSSPNGRPKQIAVAVNRCRRRFLGGIMNRQHVETVFGNEKVFYVSEEPTVLESINTGMPVGAIKTTGTFAKEIAAIAEFCSGLKSSRRMMT
jgi:pilus assembly protein CpaE